MSSKHTERVLEYLWPSTEAQADLEVYSILDAARDGGVLQILQRRNPRYDCLYAGAVPAPLREAAPYLVHLQRGSAFPAELIERSWGKSWGVFLATTADFATVRRHLRTLLLVQSEQGKQLYFRYYDPRVLRGYLPTCNTQELRLFFGPIQHYFAEGVEGRTLKQYSPHPGTGADLEALRLQVVTHDL